MRSARQLSEQLAYLSGLALCLQLPFELMQPIATIAGLQVSNLELTAYLALTAAAIALCVDPAQSPAQRLRRSALWWPGLAFVALVLLSALLAPHSQLSSLKFAGRLVVGFGLGLLIPGVVDDDRRRRGLLTGLACGCGISALVGLAEAANWPGLETLLSMFRAAPIEMGGYPRVSATFPYPTIASMYAELALPLLLVLAAGARTTITRGAFLLIALVTLATQLFTVTRAGVLTIGLVLAGMLVYARVRRRFGRLSTYCGTALICLTMGLATLALVAEPVRVRLVTETDADWYDVRFQTAVESTVNPAEIVTVMVTGRNTGRITWWASGPQRLTLTARWLRSPDGAPLALPSLNLPIPTNTAPGAEFAARLTLPTQLPPGDYLLVWGLVFPSGVWFHERDGSQTTTRVHVPLTSTAAPVEAIPNSRPPDTLPRPAAVPAGQLQLTVPRSALWPIAWQMFTERPLIGYGPDSFRHLYGSYLQLPEWDQTLHANNLYLELLADVGLVGLAAFSYLIARALAALVSLLRSSGPTASQLIGVGLAGSLASFLLHGLLDYFLEFSSTGLLFWLVLGLAATPPRLKHPAQTATSEQRRSDS